MTQPPFEVAEFLDDMPGEFFFGITFAHVGFLEVVECVVELHVVINCLGTVLVSHLGVFLDMVEVLVGDDSLYHCWG